MYSDPKLNKLRVINAPTLLPTKPQTMPKQANGSRFTGVHNNVSFAPRNSSFTSAINNSDQFILARLAILR